MTLTRRRLLASACLLALASSAKAASFAMFMASTPLAPVTGWTTVAVTAPSAQGGVATPAGSRLIYVSSSTGNDTTGDGTQATPYATVSKGVTKLRDGKPDQLLFLSTDTWTLGSSGDQGFDYLLVNGVTPTVVGSPGGLDPTGVVGSTCTGPMLISAYGPTSSRPLFLCDSGLSDQIVIGSLNGHSGGDNIVVKGLDFYAYKRDPNNVAYSFAEAITPLLCMRWLNSFTFVLIEDVHTRYFVNNQFEIATLTPGNLCLNRNVVTDHYNPGNNGAADNGHSQGFFVTNNTDQTKLVLTLIGNVLDRNGWCPDLLVPYSCTANSGTNTFTASTTPKFGNGQILAPATTANGFTAWSQYFVINLSGNSFQLSLTAGGSPVSFTGSAAQSFQWASISGNIRNRNAYLDCLVNATGNIFARSSCEGAQFRSGGNVLNNSAINNAIGFTVGHNGDGFPAITSATAQFNVVFESGDCEDPINGSQTINGRRYIPEAGGISIENANTSGIFVDSNIVTHVLSTATTTNQGGVIIDTTCTGVKATNNIGYVWANPIKDMGASSVLTPANVQDATGSNSGGPPEPFITGPSRTVETYAALQGLSPTIDAFMTEARKQAQNNWRPAYTAAVLNNYVRAGFDNFIPQQ